MLAQGKYTVGELADACELPSEMTSEHLRLMQHCGILASEKQGRKVYYDICEPHVVDILKCIETQFGSGK